MDDDQPLPDSPAAKIWTNGSYDFLSAHDLRQMAAFVCETAGPMLALESDVELWNAPKENLFALAVRAKRAELNVDVIGSLLVLAISRGSTIAWSALVEALNERLEPHKGEANKNGDDSAGQHELERIIREVQARLHRHTILDQFDNLQKEFKAADEAVTLAEISGQFRQSGVDGTTHRVLAPRLKSLRHIESEGEEFRILTAPLPLWQPSVRVKELATVLALEFPHLVTVSEEIAAFVAGGSAASMRPIVLVGPAAIGKDSIMRRAAEISGRPHAEYDLAGSSDNRTYAARPRAGQLRPQALQSRCVRRAVAPIRSFSFQSWTVPAVRAETARCTRHCYPYANRRRGENGTTMALGRRLI